MGDFRFLLIFCLTFLGCNNWPKNNTTPFNNEPSSKTTMSKEEKSAAVLKFDSLLHSGLQKKWSNELKGKTQDLNECLAIAQSLNNDNMLATVYLRLSGYYDDIGDYNFEIDLLNKAFEKYEASNNYDGCATVLNNMSWSYIQAFDNNKGIECARKGILFVKKIPDADSRYRILNYLYATIALAFLENNQLDSALKYNKLSYKIFPYLKRGRLNQYCWLFATFGNIYALKKDFINSEISFKKVLEFKDSNASADAAVYTIGKYCHSLNNQLRYNEAIAIGKEGMDIGKKTGLVRYQIDIADELRSSYENLQNTDSAYVYSKIATQLRDSIFNTRKSIQLQSMSFNRDLKAKELKFEIEKAKTEEKLNGAQRLKNIFLIGFVLVMLFAVLFLYQRNKIRAGKVISDGLLLNILPEEVADELKKNGSTLAKHYESVTVMFTDFKNFTQIAERLSPQQLVSEIDTCFKAFDKIIEKYNIEKIKTIGDSYMCVGGLPVSNTTHATDIVNAAIEFQQFIAAYYDQNKALGKELFEIRIGIHTGPVVAGIVGTKKFAYDIWGDTVNIASRMESSGEVGKVNISETTYELIKDQFSCTYRGKVTVKNKGDLDMYFVDGRKG